MFKKRARMSAKSRAAINLMAGLLGAEPHALKADPETVKRMYEKLKEVGYQWDAESRVWRFVAEFRPPETLTMTTACLASQRADVEYILLQSMNAAGFEILHHETVISPIDVSVAMISIEVRL